MRISTLCTSDIALVASTVEPAGSASTSSRCTVGALNTSSLPTYIGCLRPASVSLMPRPKPISRPFGFLRTLPPAAAVITCRPQQEPNIGVPVASAARTRSICRITSGAAVVDVQRGAGDGDAVIAFERLALRQRRGRIARMAGVHDRARQQLAQQVGIALMRRGSADRDVFGQRLRRIAFDDEQAGGGHWALNGRASSRVLRVEPRASDKLDMAKRKAILQSPAELCGLSAAFARAVLEVRRLSRPFCAIANQQRISRPWPTTTSPSSAAASTEPDWPGTPPAAACACCWSSRTISPPAPPRPPPS